MACRTGVSLVAVLVTWFVLSVGVHRVFGPKPQDCNMTYMWPGYKRIRVPSQHQQRYSLFLYQEGGTPRSKIGAGVPVLFLPGQAGDKNQVRSIGSVAARAEQHAALRHYHGGPLDVFAADFNEEFSALSGSLLQRQAHYANDCVSAILALYKKQPRKTVIVIGHSMGGVVARYMLLAPNYLPGSVENLLTLATPHRSPPVVLDPVLQAIYTKMNCARHFAADGNLSSVAIVSLAGGANDVMVRSDLALLLPQHVPATHAVSMLVTGMEGVWLSTDHQCILWCNQVVVAIVAWLHRLVALSSATPHERTRAASHHFQTELRTVSEDVPLLAVEVMPTSWPIALVEVISSSWSILVPQTLRPLIFPQEQARSTRMVDNVHASTNNTMCATVQETWTVPSDRTRSRAIPDWADSCVLVSSVPATNLTVLLHVRGSSSRASVALTPLASMLPSGYSVVHLHTSAPDYNDGCVPLPLHGFHQLDIIYRNQHSADTAVLEVQFAAKRHSGQVQLAQGNNHGALWSVPPMPQPYGLMHLWTTTRLPLAAHPLLLRLSLASIMPLAKSHLVPVHVHFTTLSCNPAATFPASLLVTQGSGQFHEIGITHANQSTDLKVTLFSSNELLELIVVSSANCSYEVELMYDWGGMCGQCLLWSLPMLPSILLLPLLLLAAHRLAAVGNMAQRTKAGDGVSHMNSADYILRSLPLLCCGLPGLSLLFHVALYMVSTMTTASHSDSPSDTATLLEAALSVSPSHLTASPVLLFIAPFAAAPAAMLFWAVTAGLTRACCCCRRRSGRLVWMLALPVCALVLAVDVLWCADVALSLFVLLLLPLLGGSGRQLGPVWRAQEAVSACVMAACVPVLARAFAQLNSAVKSNILPWRTWSSACVSDLTVIVLLGCLVLRATAVSLTLPPLLWHAIRLVCMLCGLCALWPTLFSAGLLGTGLAMLLGLLTLTPQNKRKCT